MKKISPFLSLVLLLQSTSLPLWAIQRHHKPWFFHPKTSASELVETPASSSVPVASTIPVARVRGNNAGKLVVAQALRYKGTRYKFGGTTKSGMDCSGLVARVWADLKMNKIPRASSALFKSGRPVHLADLKPGDLVFFKNTYKHGISHVGVYAGNNKFIHAAGKRRGVTIARLSDPYYQLHYAGARRLY